jgi:hypothetical protein
MGHCMTLGQLIVLHLMAGVGVAGAVFLATRGRSSAQRWFAVATATVFWPLYLPLLLAKVPRGNGAPVLIDEPPADDLAKAIAQVDGELEAALRSLDGWAEDALAREKDRLYDLRSAWNSQAQRIRDMDRLLARPEFTVAEVPLVGGQRQIGTSERLRTSQQVMHRNIDRLRELRERTLADLLDTLAWVRELASMIHLAKFTGAPPSRAEELVSQIAAAVEGLSAMSWPEAG